ncbi:hypothetical protein [Pseudochrobactrum sp. MP213Fo]|uniref:hypothetical protein n=1 Tax=Pseudochrobactrum sp. MP213Fo TaxID=3022250 RepID=UPI003B9E217A
MMEWLSGLVGENTAQIISFVALFAVFLIAVFVVFAAIKRMTAGTYVSKSRDAAPRLTVTDAAAVDSQRRLVLVRRDDVEHLILIGGPTDIVIEQNIMRNKATPNDDAAPHSQNRHQQERIVSAPQYAAAPAQLNMVTPETAAIVAAIPAYQPESEMRTAPARADANSPAPAVKATAVPPSQASASASPNHNSQPLQTHAQQVAAARQQQGTQQRPSQQVAAPAATQRPTEPVAAKLHPVYPLGQVSRGVVAATSGLAAANNAAQQELIAAAKRENRAPSLDDVRPGSNQHHGQNHTQNSGQNPGQNSGQNSGDTGSLVLQRATPQIARNQQQEPSFSTPPARNAAPAQASSFDLDLENAVAEALSADDSMSFENLLSNEIEQHFTKAENAPQQATEAKKPQSGALNISATE